jgi:hypothetical protein
VRLVLLPWAAFALLALVTSAPALISALNYAQFAASIAVCVFYSPVAARIAFQDRGTVEAADWLAFGIWLSWLRSVVLTTWSTSWRWAGRPLWLANTDIVAWARYTQTVAAICHLAAPQAVANRVPPAMG